MKIPSGTTLGISSAELGLPKTFHKLFSRFARNSKFSLVMWLGIGLDSSSLASETSPSFWTLSPVGI